MLLGVRGSFAGSGAAKVVRRSFPPTLDRRNTSRSDCARLSQHLYRLSILALILPALSLLPALRDLRRRFREADRETRPR
jgi:hypothetical protein